MSDASAEDRVAAAVAFTDAATDIFGPDSTEAAAAQFALAAAHENAANVSAALSAAKAGECGRASRARAVFAWEFG